MFILVCFILEIISIVFVCIEINSHCVQGGEASTGVMVFLLIVCGLALADIVLIILALGMRKLLNNPFGLVYNGLLGILMITASIVLLVMLTLCGAQSSRMLLASAILMLVSGIVHGLAIIKIHRKLSPVDWERRSR